MRARKLHARLAFFLLGTFILLVSACGGSSSSSSTTGSVDCSLPQNELGPGCGRLALSIADVTGDFASYVVGVNQVTLVRDDGVVVNALAAPAQVDFTQLVDASQLMATAYVPSGTYVSMSLTLDFGSADIEAEGQSGQLVKLSPVDSSGAALGVTTVNVQLGSGNTIVVQHDSSTLASLDFDLDASNSVDLSATPPTVMVSPVLYAAADFTDLPTSTAMGKLVSVDTSTASYVVDVQPLYYTGSHTFGTLAVVASSGTTFDVNGAAYTGAAGIQAMVALAAGTPTLAYGSFSPTDDSFKATEVYAGSSVPGATLDAVKGSVLSRNGNTLTVRGVTYVQSTGAVIYHSLVTVTLGAKTVVYQAGAPGTHLAISAVSVGQRVALLGTLTNTDPAALALDAGSADTGYARLAISEVGGALVSKSSSGVVLNLSEINNHRVSWYNFSGTGATSADDADPTLYQVNTGSLDLSAVVVGSPVEVKGLVQPFGAAPPDFNAATVGNYSLDDARLMVNWRPSGSTAPFSVFTTSQIVINLSDPNLGPLQVLRRGSEMTDLTALPSSPLIVPPANGLGTYAIRQNGVVTVYVSFSAFATDFKARMTGTTRTVGFFATGGYASGTFTATRIAASLK